MFARLKKIFSGKYSSGSETFVSEEEMKEMAASEVVRLRYRFYGFVQGVGFRWRAQNAARSLNLTGWVENEDDGSVLMEVQGPKALIDRMLIMIQTNSYVEIKDFTMQSLPLKEDERGFRVSGY